MGKYEKQIQELLKKMTLEEKVEPGEFVFYVGPNSKECLEVSVCHEEN